MLSHVTQHSMEVDGVAHFAGDETSQKRFGNKPNFILGLISKLIFSIGCL